jgi:hypothetical protein
LAKWKKRENESDEREREREKKKWEALSRMSKMNRIKFKQAELHE